MIFFRCKGLIRLKCVFVVEWGEMGGGWWGVGFYPDPHGGIFYWLKQYSFLMQIWQACLLL
jgi:hypothetical protein